jgi:hypothetical protein
MPGLFPGSWSIYLSISMLGIVSGWFSLNSIFFSRRQTASLGQDSVGLTEPSPQIIDSFMRLLLSRTVHPINPVFEVARAAFM